MRPITMQVNYTLNNIAPVSPDDLEPVLDDYIPTVVTAQVCTIRTGMHYPSLEVRYYAVSVM